MAKGYQTVGKDKKLKRPDARIKTSKGTDGKLAGATMPEEQKKKAAERKKKKNFMKNLKLG